MQPGNTALTDTTYVSEAFCPNVQPRARVLPSYWFDNAHTRMTVCSVPPGHAQREPQGYAGLTKLAGLRAPLSSLRLSRSCCKQVEPGGTRQNKTLSKTVLMHFARTTRALSPDGTLHT